MPSLAQRSKIDVDARLQQVVAIHFDPESGAPYWLDRAKQFAWDPREKIRSIDDLHLLGVTETDSLHACPLEDFVPRSRRANYNKTIIAQTGGTLGRPVWTAYSPREFEDAFVQPFVSAAEHVGFPTGGTWLYAGPAGPHVIGRAAEAIARRTGSPNPFSVDFDARWAKKLTSGSFAAKRYLQHIVDQAMAIVERQGITCLFTTPTVLAAISDSMTRPQRDRIIGVHYGGAVITTEQMEQFQTRVFPNAIHLSGYGNTLLGCCLELAVPPSRELRYYPFGSRVLFGVGPPDGSPESPVVEYRAVGREGQLMFTRLDDTVFLANVRERDMARLVEPPDGSPDGFHLPGVASPSPFLKLQTKPSIGLY